MKRLTTSVLASISKFIMASVLAVAAVSSIAQDLPEYMIQPGDVLAIQVWKETDLMQEVVVRPDGKFSFPLVGDIDATGKSVVDVQTQISEKISTFIPDPVVTVQVRQINGNAIFVVGQVNRPGTFVMVRPMNVMQALAMAGGTSTFANLGKIRVLRRENGMERAIRFDYGDVASGDDLAQNIMLQAGDVVVVP